MAFDIENSVPPGARIKLIGVGGGGGNAVNTMIESKLDGVEFVVANTDVQALRSALADTKIQIGKALTKGLGAGADPDMGREAALEDRHEIAQVLEGADMVFITAGMGGGTGTGAAAVISQIARELGALTVGVVTKPFDFEGKRRRRHAELGIERLKDSVDTLITIPNQKLLQIATPDLTMMNAFKMADNVLVNAVRGISDIINVPGTINVDFADVKTVMSSMGHALMGIGMASGEKRAIQAARQAISSPLLEDIDIEGATGILINITASSNISLLEISEACSIIQEAAHEEANIIFGAAIDESLGDEIRVTVIATGFPMERDLETTRSHEATIPSQPRKNILGSTGQPFPKPAASTLAKKPLERHDYQPQSPFFSEDFPKATPVAPPTRGRTGAAAQASEPETGGKMLERQETGNETEALARWTMDHSHQDGANGTREGAAPIRNVPPEWKEEEAPAPIDGEQELFSEAAVAPPKWSMFRDDRSEAGFTGNRPRRAPLDDAMKVDAHEAKQIAETGLAGNADLAIPSMQADMASKIDEALDIAERLHSHIHDPKINHEELDIPAFIRNGMKDIPIS